MSLTTDLVAHLEAHAGLAALVADRIYARELPPEAVLPAVTYQRISGPRDFSHDGPALANPRYQFSCFAVTYLTAEAVALQVQAALDGWNAAYGFPAFADDPYDLPAEPETGVYGVAVDAEIWHR